jgi:hypothetical protein
MQSNQLLNQLEADTRQLIAFAHFLQQEPSNLLLQNPSPGKWSVAQVLEHLNGYGNYYLPLLEKEMLNNNMPAEAEFKPGWLGNYFTKLMLPGENGKIGKKIQAPKDRRPPTNLNPKEVLTTFLSHQQQLIALLEKAKTKNIGKIRVPISLTRFIKLKAGGTFRFLVAHEQRHFYQIKNNLIALESFSDKYPAIHLAA